MWQWLTQSNAGLALRIGAGAGILSILAIVDLRRRGREATRWREYLFLLICVSAAMLYGAINDAITSSISWEYYSYGKGLWPDVIAEAPPNWVQLKLHAALIGIKATWTAGLIVGAVLLIANNPRRELPQLPPAQLARIALIIPACAVACAILLGVCGSMGWLARLNSDFEIMVRKNEMRPFRFMSVFGIHLGGYIGGLLGAVAAALLTLRRRRAAIASGSSAGFQTR